jgi:hypothetical protein
LDAAPHAGAAEGVGLAGRVPRAVDGRLDGSVDDHGGRGKRRAEGSRRSGSGSALVDVDGGDGTRQQDLLLLLLLLLHGRNRGNESGRLEGGREQ